MKKLFLLLFSASLMAASYEAPWLGNPYEFEGELEGALAYYRTINTSNGRLSYKDYQKLARASLECSLTDWQFVLEAFAARTAKESFNLISGAFLARYNILNDVDGSAPMSLTIGFKGDFPKKQAIQDPGLLYSYYCQGELQLSAGKEWSEGPYWQWRVWLLGALGSSTRYSPWLKGKVGIERNFCDLHRLSCYLLGQEGFGQSSFPGIDAFVSYGPLAYRLSDISFQYRYTFRYLASLGIEYTMRLAARQCPANRQAVSLTLNIPFSII
ncbi:MAG: hypothetical protein WCN87_00590 [Chlamydiota bacterium]